MHEMHKRETSTWHRMTDEGHLESKTKMMDESQSCLATNSKIKNERQMKQHKSNYKWRTTRAVHAIPRIRDRRRHDAEWEARSQATRVCAACAARPGLEVISLELHAPGVSKKVLLSLTSLETFYLSLKPIFQATLVLLWYQLCGKDFLPFQAVSYFSSHLF